MALQATPQRDEVRRGPSAADRGTHLRVMSNLTAPESGLEPLMSIDTLAEIIGVPIKTIKDWRLRGGPRRLQDRQPPALCTVRRARVAPAMPGARAGRPCRPEGSVSDHGQAAHRRRDLRVAELCDVAERTHPSGGTAAGRRRPDTQSQEHRAFQGRGAASAEGEALRADNCAGKSLDGTDGRRVVPRPRRCLAAEPR